MSRICFSKRQAGQALVEAVIWGSVIMLFFFGLPMLGKYIDVRHKHMEATRYALWERTIWSVKDKSEDELNEEVNNRFMLHDGNQILSGTSVKEKENPEFIHRGQGLLKTKGNKHAMLAEYSYVNNPEENGWAAKFAYKGLPGGAALGFSKNGFGLRGDGYTKLSLTTNMVNRFNPEDKLKFDAEGGGYGTLSLTTTGAILADSWSVGIGKKDLSNSVMNMVADNPIKVAGAFGTLASRMTSFGEREWIFGEGYNANKVNDYVSQDVLPGEYVKKDQ